LLSVPLRCKNWLLSLQALARAVLIIEKTFAAAGLLSSMHCITALVPLSLFCALDHDAIASMLFSLIVSHICYFLNSLYGTPLHRYQCGLSEPFRCFFAGCSDCFIDCSGDRHKFIARSGRCGKCLWRLLPLNIACSGHIASNLLRASVVAARSLL
jgi:hypothetical protein